MRLAISVSRSGWLAALVLLAVCSDDPPPISPEIEFVALSEGEVLGGPQLVRVEYDTSIVPARVDLFVHDELAGSSDEWPFLIDWDTAGFEEGAAELRASVRDTGDNTYDAVIGVVIDNTPPEIAALPERVEFGTDVEVTVTDANRLILVELSGPSGFKRTWKEPPFTLRWDVEECGTAEVSITAVDEAIWPTIRTDRVETFRPRAEDCPGPDDGAAGRE
jgi:hypothetical protein